MGQEIAPVILVIDDQISATEDSRREFLGTVQRGASRFHFLDGYDETEKAYAVSAIRTAVLNNTVPVPDIILLDVNFGVDGRLGYQFLDWLTANYPHIPIVMMTAEERNIYLDDALSGGALDYLTKPIEASEFWALVHRYTAHDPLDRLIGQHDQALQAIYLLNRFLMTGSSILVEVDSPRERALLLAYIDRLRLFDGDTALIRLADVADPGTLPDQAWLYAGEVDQLNRREQAGLLRLLRERTTKGLGTHVLSTSRGPLSNAVRSRKFSNDLYSLLSDRVAQWPPLAERPSDAAMILRSAVISRARETPGKPRNIEPGFMQALYATGAAIDVALLEQLAADLLEDWPDEADRERFLAARFGSRGDRPAATGARPQVSDVDRFLSRVSAHDDQYTIEHDGAGLIVLPGVFSPRYSHSSDFLIGFLAIKEGVRALDLGCGTGVLGLATLRRGAEHCTFVDINPLAVENTRLNMMAQGFEQRGRVLLSDLFDGVEGRFGVIVTNPPFWNRKPSTMLERSCFDDDHQFIRRLLSQAENHLTPTGSLYMVLSDQSDVALVNRLIGGYGWRTERLLHQVAASPSGGTPHVRIAWELSRRNLLD